jgi:hypothetical protein
MARAKNPKTKRDVKKIWLPRKHSISPMMRTIIQSFVSKYTFKKSIHKASEENFRKSS